MGWMMEVGNAVRRAKFGRKIREAHGGDGQDTPLHGLSSDVLAPGRKD